MNTELIIADLQKSFAAVRERFRKPKEKTVQITKVIKTDQSNKTEYSGPAWFPEAKLRQLEKQLEGEKLEAALNALTDSQITEVVKAVTKRSSVNMDYWYGKPTGIFI